MENQPLPLLVLGFFLLLIVNERQILQNREIDRSELHLISIILSVNDLDAKLIISFSMYCKYHETAHFLC